MILAYIRSLYESHSSANIFVNKVKKNISSQKNKKGQAACLQTLPTVMAPPNWWLHASRINVNILSGPLTCKKNILISIIYMETQTSLPQLAYQQCY